MPLQATSGAASYDAFGGGVPAVPKYIEDYFSTYLVTGDGTAPAVNNGIDLSTKGGLVWIKKRSAAGSHSLFDTARGANLRLISNDTAAQDSVNLSFTTTGFSNYTLDSGVTYASWSWAKAPKFFDVVTFTKSSSPQTISHNLGSTPGCIFIKRTDSTGGWLVAHRGYTGGITAGYTLLNTTDAFTSNANAVTAADSTTFTLGSAIVSGDFVAYLFAHDAGGFGLTGTDNVISCGSFTGTGATGNAITLGYEPQFVIVKRTDTTADWITMDAMRGGYLKPNTSDAELGGSGWFNVGGDNFFPTATGFQVNTSGAAWNASGGTYIYIAIRRGPMAVPTSGTSVFSPEIGLNASTNGLAFDSGFVSDFLIRKYRPGATNIPAVSRLTGDKGLYTTTTGAEYTETYASKWDSMLGVLTGTSADFSEQIGWVFKRAPSTFDEVCWTGNNGSNQRVNHNLGVVPELIIYKGRNKVNYWRIYYGNINKYIALNLTDAEVTGTNLWGSSAPTATDFGINCGSMDLDNFNAVAYLWATNAGVTKVGSYTGNGSSQTINCGFTGGSRMVLIIRTDASGDRYIWDSARGIVSGNDPHLSLNSTAAEVTTDDTIDTDSTGFIVNQVSATNCNVSGANYIFLSYA